MYVFLWLSWFSSTHGVSQRFHFLQKIASVQKKFFWSSNRTLKDHLIQPTKKFVKLTLTHLKLELWHHFQTSLWFQEEYGSLMVVSLNLIVSIYFKTSHVHVCIYKLWYFFLSGTIIIPYRDREEHLRELLGYLHPFLQAQNLSYRILVIEQIKGKPFNRAKLFNIGVAEALVCF